MLRKARKEQTELGKKAEAYMDSGKLVPDEIINGIVIEGIQSAERTVIIDGFPRTVGQAEAMLNAKVYPNKVIELYVDDEIVIQRAKDRIVCDKCGEPYTTNNFKHPKTEGVCDKCGGNLSKRKDDDEEVVRERLNVYKNETYPVLKILKTAEIKIHTIDNTCKDARKQFEELLNN